MAKVPKRRRIKPGTVLIKRCIKSNTKNKSFSSLYSKYQKLKINNHALAKALSQEKQETQLLFSRNVELIAEQQNLIYACNQRDNLIKIIYRNAKNLLPMIVDMSKFVTDTIAECQNFNCNLPTHRASSSSTGRRESTKRLSMKSPARGVVKPMVSGHTITKPVINLSRVNLSVIAEGPATPERNHSRVVESRRSRVMPERLAINDLRNEDSDEHVIVNRRTSRFSSGRLSSGRYSKRDSGRLSGSLGARLSKRSSEHIEILKSPRVALQDVSRYMANNQSINVRMFSETTNTNVINNITTVEDTEMSESQSSPENPLDASMIIPETQESAETSDDDDDDTEGSETIVRRKHSSIVQPSSRRSQTMESELIDPLEGPSWMYSSQEDMEFTGVNNSSPSSGEEPTAQAESPLSSLSSNERRSSTCFRIPEMPKNPGKTKRNLRVGFGCMGQNGYTATSNDHLIDDEDEEDDQTCQDIRRFITQRRGPSTRGNSSHYDDYYDDDVDDEDTLLLNIRRPIQPPPQRRPPTQQFEQPEQSERMAFDINELLELTPLKPLRNIMAKQAQLQNQVEVEPELTATIQLTQRLPMLTETETLSRISTVKMPITDQQSTSVLRCQETERKNGHEKRFSELTTAKVNGNINLPRLTDVHDTTIDNHSQLLDDSLPITQKRKRAATKPLDYTASDVEEEAEIQKQKKVKQPKKKEKDTEKRKDPSSAKVVLQKLNNSQHGPQQSERKNSNESISSARSSGLRMDQSSDSESAASKTGRPRRQKAPKNLQEPSLSKKLRRL
ncbi:uncharacterized protein LOC131666923 [Phymastichus coffea]|uniref:uncharacterized protein LOC131666923 n=1 Tax=Phymastichus coffea TaxID=108790 RepID=UPI00273A7C5E|nr:uncharacterized protein LOC131666923 [Phymastichus coffea]XP_058796003.1 uncharacterized protein LOC131666923 [Phymastichus coffea]